MKLVIVESPTKAKKIASFLGDSWRVEASRGHIRDLPRTALGVDVARDFSPTYELLPRKGNLVRRLMKAIQEADAIYLATDPDREGEAIAWHLLQMAQLGAQIPVHRATFTAITKEAVLDALDNPRQLDTDLVEAQQTRRIIDRLVGYLVSPLACKALDDRLSAGRVQSVCLRLVVEREAEIEAFTSQPYWTVAVELNANGQTFVAQLHRIKKTSPQFTSAEQAQKLSSLLKNAQVWVAKVGQHSKERKPFPPFTTSSLQQAAAKGRGFSPERTMQLAQTLYEAGYITYHRTDGVSVAPEAQKAAGMYILKHYGKEYLPEKPPVYASKSANAQEAHEAIRPTDL
ncbi:MAG: DNA topoisomerase, partial [Chloroflexota bacterium]